MATLELTLDEELQARPLKRGRRLGPLFWAANGWMVRNIRVAVT